MSRTVWLLTASTVVLTGSTLYYARQLGELRTRVAPAGVPANMAASVPAAGIAPMSPAGEPASSTSAAAVETPPAEGKADASADPLASYRARHADAARDHLARLNDPEQRADLIERETESRQRRLRKLAQSLKLTDEQFDALVKLQVDERIDNRTRSARCILDAGCLMPAPAAAELEERRRAVTESIGEGKLAQLRAEDRRGPETAMVEKLQSRLPPELRLKPAEEEAFVDAMGDELRQMLRELRTGDNQVSMYGGYGVVPYIKGLPGLEENMEMARRSSRRLNERAAMFLTGKRLETFHTLQADGVVMFREFMRRQISWRTAAEGGNP
jgi:hypothetical protein